MVLCQCSLVKNIVSFTAVSAVTSTHISDALILAVMQLTGNCIIQSTTNHGCCSLLLCKSTALDASFNKYSKPRHVASNNYSNPHTFCSKNALKNRQKVNCTIRDSEITLSKFRQSLTTSVLLRATAPPSDRCFTAPCKCIYLLTYFRNTMVTK